MLPQQVSPAELDRVREPKPIHIPVTDDQKEIWLASQLSSDASVTYHGAFVIRIEGAVDRSILESALQELVNRHDALRITIANNGDGQIISPLRDQMLETVAINSNLSGEEIEGLWSARIVEPFNLEQGPLFRSILFHHANDSFSLLLVAHHIVVDGWSWGVLLKELGLLYSEMQAGLASSLRPAMQYRDYVSWLNHDVTKAKETSDKEYWLEAFHDPPLPLDLPADHPRPAVKTFRAGQHRAVFDSEFYAQLREASQQHRCTLFQLLLASVVGWLFKITGQSDIVVGIPHAGQMSSDLLGDLDGSESLVGHCASLLPIRIRRVGDQSFDDLILSVKQRLIESSSHLGFTFSKVAKAIKLRRDPSRVPLVSVSLTMVRASGHRLENLDTEVVVPAKAFGFFDLTLDLLQGDQDLSLDTSYNSDLYDEASIVAWHSQWRRILEQVIASPSRPVSQLDLLTEGERGRVVEGWNATRQDYLRDGVLHGLCERSADRDPERTALVFGEQSLTFRELEERANRIAHQLREMGAQPGQLVGVCLERSPDLVATLLAILKSGAAYVPLDPTYPADRTAYVLEDAGATILVSEDKVVKGLGTIPCRVLSLDGDAGRIEERAASRPEPLAGPEDLAYVIYTSGSTGRPKGVQIEHRAVVNFVQSMAERPGLGSDDVLLAVTTAAFDIAVLELFLPMYVGARIVLASRETARDPDALQLALRRQGVTVMQATPATWRMLIEAGWAGSPRLNVLCGGEALPRDLAAQLLPRCAALWNMYGPTETTVWSTCGQIVDAADIHIGTPIANTQVYIVDEALQPRPVGMPGELMIGGDGLARGYLGQPELTVEQFIASPFQAGHRLYRTGDLAKFREDGSIECLGRTDFQVKIRGFRVELGEIESVLASEASIEQAVVVAREDRPGAKSLIAYVRLAAGATIDEAALRNAVTATLPDYMVPSRVVALDAFPLTLNGKIDRRALPEPLEQALKKGADEELPQGEIEKGLETILRDILRIPRVGRHENFFDIGGHSLLAVSYFNEIARSYGIRLPLGVLLRAGSIARLAVEIENHNQSRRAPDCLVQIQVDGTKPKLFAVHGAGGNVLFYRALSKALGDDVPFYGLQSCGLDGSSAPLTSIEAMAKAYIGGIKTVQATGPYHLGGYCLGGIIAYEMARLLKEQGDEVALLALWDSYNPARLAPVTPLSHLMQRVYFHVRNLIEVPFGQWKSYMHQKLQIAREGELRLITDSILGSRKTREESLQQRIHSANFEAAMRYRPKPYPGVVTSFRPRVKPILS